MKSFSSFKLGAAAIGAAVALTAAPASAAVIPFGVQNDVTVATVTGTWGWTEIWRGAANGEANFSTMFANAGTHVLVAGFKTGSSTVLEVLAATTTADALAYTGLNQTKLTNGARWYSNGFSFGFAGANDTISQNTADIAGDNERDRLSWHTSHLAADPFSDSQDATKQAASVFYGYRHGNQYTNGGGGDRVIYTLNFNAAVPEPGTWALLILGFGFVGGAMRSAQRKQVTVSYA